jgi:hypothetical protein
MVEMSTPRQPRAPLVGLGMTSLVISVIALLLFLFPVLGIPLSALGVVFGVIGLVAALVTSETSLRWSVGGIAVSCLALAVNLAIANAPAGYVPGRRVPQLWRPEPYTPYVPPPARPAEWPG